MVSGGALNSTHSRWKPGITLSCATQPFAQKSIQITLMNLDYLLCF